MTLEPIGNHATGGELAGPLRGDVGAEPIPAAQDPVRPTPPDGVGQIGVEADAPPVAGQAQRRITDDDVVGMTAQARRGKNDRDPRQHLPQARSQLTGRPLPPRRVLTVEQPEVHATTTNELERRVVLVAPLEHPRRGILRTGRPVPPRHRSAGRRQSGEGVHHGHVAASGEHAPAREHRIVEVRRQDGRVHAEHHCRGS